MPSISSIKHPLFQELRHCRTLQGQHSLQKFLVEDELIKDALASHYKVEHIFVSDEKLNYSSEIPHYHINQGMMRKVFPQGRPPKAVAVCHTHVTPLKHFQEKKCIVILENIQDCGNLGTMLRTCEAFGVDGVIIVGRDFTHLYNRVTVRSSMGALFRLHLCHEEFSAVKQFLQEYSLPLIITSPHAKQEITNASLSQPYIVAFGNETDGITPPMMELATHRLAIPMTGQIESLNVAVSCGIVLHYLYQKLSI